MNAEMSGASALLQAAAPCRLIVPFCVQIFILALSMLQYNTI
jgi:hypothetical protein